MRFIRAKLQNIIKYMKDKGWLYAIPCFLSAEEWEEWDAKTKSKYPIQFFIRETADDIRYIFTRKTRDCYWAVYRFFNPCHKDIRRAIPRQWSDISELIVDVNAAMIISFKKEADASCVDWSATEGHQKFKNWLDAAAKWFATDKAITLKQLEAAYPPLGSKNSNKTYEELYGEVNRLEQLIKDTDTEFFKQMLEYRDYMWT